MKKLMALILLATMLIPFASCTKDTGDETFPTTSQAEATPETPTVPEEEIDYSKVIDIYLIAGQSNAVGFSRANSKDLYKKFPALKGGVPYIHYAGSSRYGGNPPTIRDLTWQLTKIGLGSNEGYIGPEVGMAASLSEFYNEESGRNAGIIKFAHGGSSIRDISSGENATGNWVSPSYAKYLNTSYADTDQTGGFYRGLLGQVKRNIAELKEYGGFTTVNIKGLYWMQGETDVWNRSEYETSFKYLISDLRKDLADICLDFTDGKSDCGAGDMSIFIGTISETFAAQDANMVNTNKAFITLQNKLAKEIDNCHIIDNSQFNITKYDENKKTYITVGSDLYHWNSSDMFTIGQNVGKAMMQRIDLQAAVNKNISK